MQIYRRPVERMAHEAYVRRMTRPLLVTGMGGLGDNVYERPVIRYLAKGRDALWLQTPYPEVFSDHANVRPVLWSNLHLRCQQKNMDSQPKGVYQIPPAQCEHIRMHYALNRLRGTIVEELEGVAGISIPAGEFVFDLPHFDLPPIHASRRYAVVRPVTVRREWPNMARNPEASYVNEAAKILRELGFYVVSVADIHPPHEILADDPPVADAHFLHGELRIPELLSLVAQAAVVVGGIGWIVPVSIAAHTPAIFIAGGQGGHNGPSIVIDPRMNAEKATFILPDHYCRCREMGHRCNKTISEFRCKFIEKMELVAR